MDRSKATKPATKKSIRAKSSSDDSQEPPKKSSQPRQLTKVREDPREEALMGKSTRIQEDYAKDIPVKSSTNSKAIEKKLAKLTREHEDKRTLQDEEDPKANQLEMEQLLMEQDAELAANPYANGQRTADIHQGMRAQRSNARGSSSSSSSSSRQEQKRGESPARKEKRDKRSREPSLEPRRTNMIGGTKNYSEGPNAYRERVDSLAGKK